VGIHKCIKVTHGLLTNLQSCIPVGLSSAIVLGFLPRTLHSLNTEKYTSERLARSIRESLRRKYPRHGTNDDSYSNAKHNISMCKRRDGSRSTS